MMRSRFIGAVLAATVAAISLGVASEARAEDKAEAVGPDSAPSTKKPVHIWPKNLKWGLAPMKVAGVYDGVVDNDYKNKYKKVQPGVQMQQLDAEVAEVKSQFRRSWVKFGATPTGYDQTPLKQEYTYKNKESLMVNTRKGKKRYFLYIGDRLWKLVDEHTLSKKSKWGPDFATAVAKLAKHYGVPGRVIEADPSKGRRFTEVDWRDSNTHLRAVQWSDTEFALIREDIATAKQIDSLRKHKNDGGPDIDPAVAAALAGKKKEEEKKDDKKKK